jgi:cobalt transporter subunit CbtB
LPGKERVRTAAVRHAARRNQVFVVGFSSIAAIHDAAHDVRHLSNFPCH